MLSASKGLCVVVALALASAALAQDVRLLVQSSPLAGFSYHEAAEHWDTMKVGDALELIREPENPHDPKAIRVQWRGHKLGYVPRSENEAAAWAMDRGQKLDARISRLQQDPNPRRRIELEIYAGSVD